MMTKSKLSMICTGAAFLFALTGCSGNNPVENPIDAVTLQSGEFAVFDFDDTMDQMHDATLESDMSFEAGPFDGSFFRQGGRFGRRGPGGPMGDRMSRTNRGNHLGQILPDLGLSDAQLTAIQDLMDAYRASITQPLQAFRSAIQAILDDARAERQAIMESVQAGDLTRDEARELIRALNDRKRAAIQATPEAEAARALICASKLELFDAIRNILDADQQTAWDGWVGGLDGGCFGDDDSSNG